MDDWMNGWTGVWINGSIDGLMDRQDNYEMCHRKKTNTVKFQCYCCSVIIFVCFHRCCECNILI